jgi:hypothetical protein
MGRRLGALPPKRMIASWFWIARRSDRIQGCGAMLRAQLAGPPRFVCVPLRPLTASASTDGNNLNLEGKKIALNKVT